MSVKAEKCPQCGHDSLSMLPKARRKSCSLCNYVEPESENIDLIPFQGYTGERISYKRHKPRIHLSSLLFIALMLLGFCLTFQILTREPEEILGLRKLEHSYLKTTRMITTEVLQSSHRRTKLKHQIQREKAVIRYLQVSSCLQNPRSYLVNLYTVFEKGLANPQFNFKRSRRIVNMSARFVNEALACKENFAPHQYSNLEIYTNYPDFP